MGVRSLVTPRINIRLTATVQNLLDDGQIAAVPCPSLNYNPTMASGAEANQANRAWQSESRSLVAGASETLDLYDLAATDIGAGVGMDGVGQLVSPFEEIVAIVIVNDNAIGVAGNLEVQPAGAAGWTPIGTHTVASDGALPCQGILVKACPGDDAFPVVDTVSHRITFTANGGDVEYSIYVMARHDIAVSSSSSSSSQSSSSSSLSTTSESTTSESTTSESTTSESSLSTTSLSSSSSVTSSSTSVSMSSSSWSTETSSESSSSTLASVTSASVSSTTYSSSSTGSSSSWTS